MGDRKTQSEEEQVKAIDGVKKVKIKAGDRNVWADWSDGETAKGK